MTLQEIIDFVAEGLIQGIATTDDSGDRFEVIGLELGVDKGFKQSRNADDEIGFVFADDVGKLLVREGRNQDTAHTLTERCMDADAEAKTMEKRQNRKHGGPWDDLTYHCAVADRFCVDIKV